MVGCLIWHSVYPVATDGEAVDFQQIFLRPSVFQAVSFESRVDVDYFVIILVRRGQECVRFALREGGGGALRHVGSLRIV